MRAPSAPLPPFEVAIASRSATLTRLQNVRIHSQTHRASRLTPLESRVEEYSIQPFLLRRPLHRLRSRHHHGSDLRADVMSLRHPRRRAQIFNARIRARPNKYAINADVFDPASRF